MNIDEQLELVKGEFVELINCYFDQGNTALAYKLDDILIDLIRLTDEEEND